MASRPKFWPRSFCLSLKHLASAWPQNLVVLLCNRAFLRTNRVKFRNFVNFSGNNQLPIILNIKSYIVKC